MTDVWQNFGQTDGFGIAGRENDRDGKMRELFMSNGNSAYLEAKGQYGYWYIRYKEGKTPTEVAEQTFTNPTIAEQWFVRWLNANRYDTKITSNKVEIPEVETKKRYKKEELVA